MRLRTWTTILVIVVAGALVAGAVPVPLFTVDYVSAWAQKCDFVTGGGWIVRPNGAKANFGVGGGCKNGSPTWGHLEYVDHGNIPSGTVPPPFNVHWESITAYLFIDDTTRDICGTARTNDPSYPTVDFHVRVADNGEPGVNDIFAIRLAVGGATIYTTEFDPDHRLGAGGPGGGNIQLHKPNPSTTGDFGGTCNT